MTLNKILCRNHGLDTSSGTIIMGVLNVTPDSFSDGGQYQTKEDIKRQAERLIGDGAHIIDIGGESTRPFSEPVSLDEELKRVIPAVRTIRSFSSIPISIDTTKAQVARAALDEGADIINDISALRFDEKMPALVAERKVPVILMHMKGTPRDMQVAPFYEDVVKEIREFFEERIEFCKKNNIGQDKIILDPGIGFGKRFEDNLDIINNLSEFLALDCPILVGPSRKAFLGQITGKREPGDRDNATCGAVVASILNGASMVRIHNVSAMYDAIKVADALRKRARERD